MHPSVEANFIPFTEQFEGYVQYMYLDVKGLVTTGYGNLIDDGKNPTSMLYQFDWRTYHGEPTLPRAIDDEWHRVKQLQSRALLGGEAFRDVTTLRATSQSIHSVAMSECKAFAATLIKYFPDFDAWPADAQLGTLSIAWACGPNFPAYWPKFTFACRNHNWIVAASESHIEDSHNPGVKPRNKANYTLFLNASVSDDIYELTYKVV